MIGRIKTSKLFYGRFAFFLHYGENDAAFQNHLGRQSMKSFLSLGILMFALTFCGLGDRLKNLSGSGGGGSTNSSSNGRATTSSGSSEKPELTAAQKSIQDGSTEVKGCGCRYLFEVKR